jgi:hypothetical protein
MSTIHQKAQTALWHGKFESIFRVQREFRCDYIVRPRDKSISHFIETDSVEKIDSTRRPWRYEYNEDVDH